MLGRFTLMVRAADIPDTFEEAAPDLLPAVRERFFFTGAEIGVEDEGQRVPYQPLAEVLGVGLVWNSPEALAYVDRARLRRWGVTFKQAMARALDNLGRHAGPLRVEGEGVCLSPWRDDFDTARILLPEVIRSCPVKGDPVVLLPNRSHLVVTGSADAEGLRRAVELTRELLRQPRAQGGWAVRLEGDTWRRFLPEEGSPVRAAFRGLAEESLARSYAEQRLLLERHYRRLGRSVQVAGWEEVHPGHNHGPSYCLWPRGMDTLLPKTDLVLFVDLARPEPRRVVASARWEDVMRVMGGRMEPAGTYPERYRVTTFPTEAELAQLGSRSSSEP